jgi:hypothetical protein
MLVPFLWLVADNPDPVPEADDVTAGWIAALVFVFLIVAVVFLARSLVKQLRKAQAAREAGVYGDEPTDPPSGPPSGPSSGPSSGATPKTPGAASR